MMLPKPYPDELIGSVIARACSHYSLPAVRVLENVFGKNRSTFSFLMTSDLHRLSLCLGTDPEELAHKHTMFPYATAFMSTAERCRQRDKALNTKSDGKGSSAITQSVSHAVPSRRLCTLCIKDDLSRYGETYWHRSHHLPGLHICVAHGTWLKTTSIPLRRHTQSRDTRLPAQDLVSVRPVRVSRRTQDAIARISLAAIDGAIDPNPNWHSVYRSAAHDKGYRLVGDNLASSVLAADFFRYYGKSFLTDAGCWTEVYAGNQWPSLMVRDAGTFPQPTVKHVLLQTFFELAQPSDGNFRFRKPGKAISDFGTLDALSAQKIRNILGQEKGSDRRFTVTQLLNAAGVRELFRHNRTEFPRTAELVLSFRKSSQAERQLGRRPYWRIRLGIQTPD